MSNLKIAHLIAPVKFGGGESLLYNLAKEKQFPIEEYFFLLSSSKEFEKKLLSIGNKIYIFSKTKKYSDSSLSRLIAFSFKSLLAVPKIIKICQKEGINIIHAHGFPASLIAYLLKIKNKNLKIIYTHHTYRKKRIYDTFFSIIYDKFDILTSVSYTSTSSLNKVFKLKHNQFIPVYNCINNEFFLSNYENNAHKNNEKKKYFIQIARFEKNKNQLLVIEALKLVPIELLENIEIHFIGDGPTLADCKEKVNSYNLQKNIKFLGFVDNLLIPKILKNYDFGLFPSELEGFGIAAVECMAAGLPVLALDNDLMREIVGDNGILVDKDNFSQGFKMIMTKQFDKKSIIHWTKQFEAANVKRKYFDLYVKLLK